MRTLPPGIDQRSASRHPDWTGPDDLRIKIEELREATDWEGPRLRQDRRHPGRPRREAVRGGRCRRRGRRRHAGRDGRQPGRVHRAHRDPDAARRAPGRATRWRELGVERRGRADRVRGHPQRRRRGQGARPGRRCGVDRCGRADGSGLQPADLPRSRRRDRRGGRLPGAGYERPGAAPTATPVGARSASPPRTPTSSGVSIRRSPPDGWPTTCG